jgi:Flp pilus assembly protein TadG
MRETLHGLRFVVLKFARQSAGLVAPVFAVAMLPILVRIGVSIDYARAVNFKMALQAAVDAAVLAGAKDGSPNWIQVATDTFNGVVQTTFGNSLTATFAQTASTVYTGNVSGSVATTVLEIIHVPSINVSAAATAIAAGSDDACILTLDHGQPTSHVSLSLNGAPIVNLSGCSIRSNTALDCNGHDGSNTEAIAAGTAADCTYSSSYAPVVPDLYAALASNITTRCGSSTAGVAWTAGSLPSGPAVITVNAGAYTEYHICGDLTVSGVGFLTGATPASDSIIIIENGSLNVVAGAAVSTLRTAIVMTGNNNYSSSINFPSGSGQSASLSLSAPIDSSDPWQGVAFYQDPKLTYRIDDRWGPGATFNADGLVYLGNANVTTDGNTGSSNSKCSKFVMNSFTTNGSVDLNLSQQLSACSAVGLKQGGGIVVHLTQ